LEADLGVDTVKQAELFAAIRAAYDIPRDENLKLRDFPTIAHAVKFVYDRRPDLVHGATVPAAPAAAAAAVATADSVQQKVFDLVAEKTGYPIDMLGLDLDLEADLGIDTVKQAEIFAAVRAAYNIPREDNLKLRDFPTLAHVMRFVEERRTDVPKGVAVPDTRPVELEKLVSVALPATRAIDDVKFRVLSLVA